MYHPYFRGKQYELIAVRETAALMAMRNFVPIIEPVKEGLKGLERALAAVCDAGGRSVVVVNPYHGDHRRGGESISSFLRGSFGGRSSIVHGVLLKSDTSISDAIAYFEDYKTNSLAFIHAGFTEARPFAAALGDKMKGIKNIFIKDFCGTLYRRHFISGKRVLLQDGFEKRRNADHPLIEEFSDLHVTFRDEGADGFGDFLMVGDDYSEGGGPAYAVAIHLTFIDPDKDDVMYVYHFVSDRKDTPTDPAGKFGEALGKLVKKWESGRSKLYDTSAIREFRELYARGHFPGLGYIKKLCMKHHIETLATYLAK